jgi:hypothetical protein
MKHFHVARPYGYRGNRLVRAAQAHRRAAMVEQGASIIKRTLERAVANAAG